MHAQLVEQLISGFGRECFETLGRLRRFFLEGCFRPPAQFGGVSWVILRFHGVPPSIARSVVAMAYICPASFSRAVAIIEISTILPDLVRRCVR